MRLTLVECFLFFIENGLAYHEIRQGHDELADFVKSRRLVEKLRTVAIENDLHQSVKKTFLESV